jgi:hypothetical protein
MAPMADQADDAASRTSSKGRMCSRGGRGECNPGLLSEFFARDRVVAARTSFRLTATRARGRERDRCPPVRTAPRRDVVSGRTALFTYVHQGDRYASHWPVRTSA